MGKFKQKKKQLLLKVYYNWCDHLNLPFAKLHLRIADLLLRTNTFMFLQDISLPGAKLYFWIN